MNNYEPWQNWQVVFLYVVAMILGLSFGAVLGAGIQAEKSSRATQQCEVVGKQYNCLQYSARGNDPSAGICGCVVNGRNITFPNTYGENER
jgi:hypothetical protein